MAYSASPWRMSWSPTMFSATTYVVLGRWDFRSTYTTWPHSPNVAACRRSINSLPWKCRGFDSSSTTSRLPGSSRTTDHQSVKLIQHWFLHSSKTLGSARMRILYPSLFIFTLFNTVRPAPAPGRLVDLALAGRQILPTLTNTESQSQPTSTTPNASQGSNGGVQNGDGQTNNNGPSGGSDNGSNNPVCSLDNFDGNVCNDLNNNGDVDGNTVDVSPSVSPSVSVG